MKKIIFAILLLVGWYQFFYTPVLDPIGAGIVSGGLPLEGPADKRPFTIDDYTYSPVKVMQIDGRVLAADQHYFDKMSRISTTDIVIGWQELSDEEVLKEIDFSIFDRNYDWDNPTQKLENDFIAANTKLLHVIPANAEIKNQLRKIKRGEVIVATGYTVNVKGASGLSWRTANSQKKQVRSGVTKKTTEGDLFYIEELEIINPALRLY